MNYAQAIKGRVTGRGIGIIDAIHLVEVARSVEILEKNNVLPEELIIPVKDWFGEFVVWLTTHPYGIDEMNTKNFITSRSTSNCGKHWRVILKQVRYCVICLSAIRCCG